MSSRLLHRLRRPETWALALLAGVGLIATIDGVLIVIGAEATGPRAAAGYYVLAVGLVLAALVAGAAWQARRDASESLVAEIAAHILDDERDAGRDPSDHFSPEAESLDGRGLVRVLGVNAALILFWILALDALGFAVVTGVYCAVFMIVVARRPWLWSLISATVIAVAMHFLFASVGVRLPVGDLWPA